MTADERKKADAEAHQILFPDFSARVCDLMIARGWLNCYTFIEHTLLNKNYYYRILNKKTQKWNMKTAIIICHALGLSISDAENLLQSAELSFYSNRHNEEYITLFIGDRRNYSIEELNQYLEKNALR